MPRASRPATGPRRSRFLGVRVGGAFGLLAWALVEAGRLPD
ncbi:hypothetical protein AB0A95_19150 [Micromonospora sp. NPDC049230]